MIKNKRFLGIAILLFSLSIMISFPFPHEYPMGQELTSALNIPITTINGINYVGVTALAMLAGSLFFLVKSLEKFHMRLVLLAIVATVFLPIGLVSARCELPFKNHSSDQVTFNVEFYDKYRFEDEGEMLTLLNEGGPFEVTLQGKERKTVKVEAEIDVSGRASFVSSGGAWGVNLQIKSGNKLRKL
ncbi:hypothetical protein [Mesobacillus subterraneus]|uniref:Uncharacterized protein n=1 Tax=Mesobacillus subterraneus TaxID=285983 RepID=A0A3R9ED09_9BACI|nr:hypothetical protein [Mesobacillus subterraneus]RSD29052.1 hypothetical protein EJA10_02785 [Mesobacillus subterraneus]